MHSLQQIAKFTPKLKEIYGLYSKIPKLHLNSVTFFKSLSSKSTKNGDDEWNDAWETAWLPEDLSGKGARAQWEMDVHLPSTDPVEAADVDAETKAFVEDMNENWNERRKVTARTQELQTEKKDDKGGGEIGGSLYSLENIKKDYRLKKQRIHAGLWIKEIEKQQEANLMDSGLAGADDIDRLLDSYSEYASFSRRVILRFSLLLLSL
uniref:Uncharacterized protein n=1 Tax=Rhizophora mucronata TaxID=61149 RepID=A0A2P2JIR9_RHIMU